MIDMDMGAGSISKVYQGNSAWGISLILIMLFSLASVGLAGWYFLGARGLQKEAEGLTLTSTQLDQQIEQANALSGGKTVESRAAELTTMVKQYRTLLDGRKVWREVLPVLAQNTLQGITLNGMSIDDKLALKIDGSSVGGTSASEAYTPYGMIARQVVAYREPEIAGSNDDLSPTAQSKSKKAKKTSPQKMFSQVTLTSITQVQSEAEKAGTAKTTGKFSMTFTLNPALLKLPDSTTKNTATGGAL